MISVSVLDNLESQIRANKAPSLEDLTSTIRPQDVPRSLIARYANLLRRMGAIQYALKILNPIVRSDVAKPSVSEIIEYASCLTRLSLEDESIALLTEIRDEPNPEIQFELAAAHMSKWNFPAAIPYLKEYLKYESLSPYKICVGEVNLAASYINTHELAEAESLLQKLLIKTRNHGFDLLLGNTLELLGETALLRREFENADKYFRESAEKLLESNHRYHLYLEKWRIIVRMLKEKGSVRSLKAWSEVRKKAAELRNWNSLRELELFKVVATEDVEGLTNLYYGVPFLEFRKRILAIWGKPFKIDSFYERQIGPRAENQKKERKVFDIASGKDLYKGSKLKPGLVLHRLLQVLATDFYSPFLTTKLFSLVFRGNIFNPTTSPQQVYEAVKRLNKWFVEKEIPFTVHLGEGGYRLRSTEAYILRIPNSSDEGLRTKVDDFLDELRHRGLIENFNLRMVVESLGLPLRTASRLLSESVSSGKLSRKGKNKSTSYSFNPLKSVA